MQAFGAYAMASVDLATFAPQRRPQQSEPRSKRGRTRTLIRGVGRGISRALAQLAREPATPWLPRLDSYPY